MITDIMAKFDRDGLKSTLDPADAVEIKLTGLVLDGTPFEATDTISVIN